MAAHPLTLDLAARACGLEVAHLPAAALATAVTGFTDCVGVMLAGQDEPAVGIAARTLADATADRGESRLMFGARTLPASAAALLAGVAGHVLDYDDVALDGHPSAVLVPAILAEADALDASGSELLVAYVAGYETWAELLLRERDHLHNLGWHPTTVYGTVAAAAACARLRRLTPAQAAHALAIAASLAGGLNANFGSMTKSFQVGRAAQSGVIACRLAAAGLTGSLDAIEHPHGYLAAFSPGGNVDRERPLPPPGTFRIEEYGLNVKGYPMCYFAHRANDAILDLAARHRFGAEHVERIDVHIGETALGVLRVGIATTGLEAKFSAEFPMAAAIVAGRIGLAELCDAFVARPDVQTLMRKVRRNVLPDGHGDLPVAAADRVVVTLVSGAVLDSGGVAAARGSIAKPMTTGELWAKFDDCARALPEPVRRELFDGLQGLAALSSIRRLSVVVPVTPVATARGTPHAGGPAPARGAPLAPL
jgi:2-methylcitrate dehydratase PrpD